MFGSTLGAVELLAALAAIGGTLLVATGGRRYRRLRAVTRRAVETTGTVRGVTTQPVREASGSRSYVPLVDYEYRTPTQQREGVTVYPGDSRFAKQFGTEAAAETAIADYDPGSQTTVYYDPDDPAHSFLIAEPQTAPAISRLALGLAVLVGSGLLVVT